MLWVGTVADMLYVAHMLCVAHMLSALTHVSIPRLPSLADKGLPLVVAVAAALSRAAPIAPVHLLHRRTLGGI